MDKITVDVEYLADFFNVTARTIQNWVDDLGAPREERGKYDLIKFLKWRIRKLEDDLDIAKNSGDEKLHRLKIEGQRIHNQEKQIKLRKLLGELVEAEAVRIAWISETKIFGKALKSLINKLDTDLDEVTDRNQRYSIISMHVKDVMNTLGDLQIEAEDDKEEIEEVELDDDGSL